MKIEKTPQLLAIVMFILITLSCSKKDDEVIVVASERPVIQTVFNVAFEDVKEFLEVLSQTIAECRS